jgi:hypothetical protein
MDAAWQNGLVHRFEIFRIGGDDCKHKLRFCNERKTGYKRLTALAAYWVQHESSALSFSRGLVSMIESGTKQVETIVPKQKKPYQTPEFVRYGTVADLTATKSIFGPVSDSGKGTNKRS